MPDFLSPEERFSDRLEITGYFTAALAAIIVVVFFGMLFFYPVVQKLSLDTKALIFCSSLLVLLLGFYIPLRKNPARVLFRWFFYGFATFTYFRIFNQGEWYWGPALAYAFYILWALGHPEAIRQFRKLRSQELQQLPIAGSFTFHCVLLALYSLVALIQGILILSESEGRALYDPDKGMLLIFLSLLWMFQLIFFRRLKNWARWSVAILCLVLGIAGIPETMNPTTANYLEYWKSLAHAGYFIGLPIYLIFSVRVRKTFGPAPIAPAESTPAA